MKNNYETIIIGNGSIACSIAFQLNKLINKNAKICIIGPETRTGSASLAAGAMLNIFGEIEYDTLNNSFGVQKFEMLLKSRSLWKTFIEEINSKTNQKVVIKNGTVILNNASADNLDDLNFNAIIKSLKKYKEKYFEIDNSYISGYRPSEKNRSLKSIYIPNENFIVSAKSLLLSYDNFFKNNKNFTKTGTRATKINIKKNNLKEIIDDRGIRYYSENVVIAAGSYTQNFINQFNDLRKKIPDLFYGSGSAFILKTEKPQNIKHVIRTPNRGMACGLHVVPFNSKAIYVGATNRISHFEINKPIISSFLGLQSSLIKEINTNFNNAKIEKICIGHRPTTSDTFPILGPTSIKGLWIASGTKRDGLTLSPLIGKAIANMIWKNKATDKLLPKSFYPERKIIKTMNLKQGIEKSVKHILSAVHQHELEFPRVDLENSVTEMIYNQVKDTYKKCRLTYGVPPEILNMYKYKRVKNIS